MTVRSIAVLLTAYNRKLQTLDCLSRLFAQQLPDDIGLKVYLTDAGSTDGTANAVRDSFPHVRIIMGDSSVFWAMGMRMAFREASTEKHDWLLWLNDDTQLEPNAIESLVTTSISQESPSIVVGSVLDPCSGKPTYGGVIARNRLRPLSFSLLSPSQRVQVADAMNGNLVLISAEVVGTIGHMAEQYTHALADFDYGLTARRHGISVLVAPGALGKCARNRKEGTWMDTSLPFRKRWSLVMHPKGLPPKEWLVFTKRHAGILWPLIWASPYARVAADSLPLLKRARSV